MLITVFLSIFRIRAVSRIPLLLIAISTVLLDEIPDNIETVFEEFNTHFLLNSYTDFNISCDCPDYAVPCKHIAGVCYRLANEIGQDPLLLFEMRGLAPDKLRQELVKSPLGKILADATVLDSQPLEHLLTHIFLITKNQLLTKTSQK